MSLKLFKTFRPILDRKFRYYIFDGGRGGAKSQNIAIALIILASMSKLRILCTREIQKTIKDSVHKLLSDIILNSALAPYFSIKQESIICLLTGSEFIFKGLRSNITEIKSLEGIDICWVEEAHSVSNESWDILIPTIRKEGSNIIASFNRYLEDDPVYIRFCTAKNDPDVYHRTTSYRDNPLFPEVLEKERLRCLRLQPEDIYKHIWEGHPLKNPEGRVIKSEWFQYYKDLPKIEYKFITVDTAQKTADANDYTVFEVWGAYHKSIYLIDLYRDKVEAPDLETTAFALWDKHSVIDPGNQARLRAMHVEDMVSGTGLIQKMKREKVPVEEISRYKDKYTRILDVLPYIKIGRVFLPFGALFVHDFLKECDAFNAMFTHNNDDQIDALVDAINIAVVGSVEDWDAIYKKVVGG